MRQQHMQLRIGARRRGNEKTSAKNVGQWIIGDRGEQVLGAVFPEL